jgi:hypothetical protein
MVTDLAFGPDGSLYTLQHASAVPGIPFPFAGPGAIRKTPPGGGSSSTLVAGDLPRALGLIVGADGSLYVSVNGASSGNGAVWRIVPLLQSMGAAHQRGAQLLPMTTRS